MFSNVGKRREFGIVIFISITLVCSCYVGNVAILQIQLLAACDQNSISVQVLSGEANIRPKSERPGILHDKGYRGRNMAELRFL